MSEIIVPTRKIRTQMKVKGSKFIASVAPVWSETETHEFIQAIKSEFHDASHNVYAWCLQQSNERITRCSDDGEPSGSAGPPVLGAIEFCNLTNTVVVVTRYFGGTLLGVGGLMRAYGSVARAVLKEVSKKRFTLFEEVIVPVSYEYIGQVTGLLRSLQIELESMDYNEKGVEILLYLKAEAIEELKTNLGEIAAGTVTLVQRRQKYLSYR